MQNDLTTGSVFRNVVSFSLPYLLSYFLQTLYGMADLFIIGQFGGVASTTAVSIGSQVMHMLTVMLVGLAMGATVSIAQAAGGGDKKRTASAIGNTVTLFMLLSLALTALLLALRGGIVSIMSTPEEAVQGTLAYLTVCFIGIPFITVHNIIASIFRGLGDSKSPMYFITVACVVNIALDYYFMGTLHLGPAGAALGTTLSQAMSVLVSLAVILKRRLISVRRADFRPQRAVMGKLLQIGVPVALQDGFIQVSFVIITIIANRRGLTDAAAVGIVEKIIGFLFLIPSSMLSTVSALGAQKIGAGKPERARLTLRSAAMIACSFGIVSSSSPCLSPSRSSASSRLMPPSPPRAGNICAATSGTASLPACSSASAAISAPAASRASRFCTIRSRSCSCACRGRTLRPNTSRRRCCPWALPTPRGRFSPSSSA